VTSNLPAFKIVEPLLNASGFNVGGWGGSGFYLGMDQLFTSTGSMLGYGKTSRTAADVLTFQQNAVVAGVVEFVEEELKRIKEEAVATC
jgi:hypothetical protein